MTTQNAITATQQTAIQTTQQQLASLVDSFLQYADVSAASGATYVKGIRNFLRFMADTDIISPTRNTVIEYKQHLIQHCTASTTALYLTSIRRFFAWLASSGLYTDITSGVKSPRIDKGHKKDAFSAAQLKTVINGISRDNVKGKRDYAISALMAATGLRCIEVVRANIEDIRTVSGQAVLYVCGKGRTSKTDFVKLSAPVLQAINDYLATRGNVADNAPLFASTANRNNGQRLTTRSISRICKSAMRQAGFDSKRLTAHSLRHSAATMALLAGMSIHDVSDFLRHSSLNITLVYCHDINRLKSGCEAAISNALFN